MAIHRIALHVATLLIPLSISIGADMTVDSNIEAVSLFRDGARVTRTATIEAPAGKSTIRFELLPTNIDMSALQANIGNASGVIRNAKLFHPQNPKNSETVEALQKRLDAHQRSVREVQENINIAKSRINFVTQMSASFAKGYGELSESGASLTVEQGLKTWELVDKTQRDAQQKIENANEQIRVLAKAGEKIQQDLRDAREKHFQTQSVAEVKIELDTAQTLTLSISYQALSARWTPQYELRAAPDKATLDFGYFASIWQQTGENWTDVELSLHTNQANRRGNVPELGTMQLRRNEYYRSKTRRPNPIDNEGYMAVETSRLNTLIVARDEAERPLPSKETISVTASTVSFQVTLPSNVTVPTSKDSTTLPVTSKTFKADYWSEAVPKVQLDTYLQAKIVNEFDLPILSGVGLAFVDGKLSSKVLLEKTLPSEELELSLGTDPNIVVKRIEGAQENKNSGFLDKTTTLSRKYTNTVTSYHTVAHKIVIVDQFPIATDAKIEITRKSPKDSAVTIKEENADTGVFQWEATIKPKETLSFITEYQVVHPRDWTIAPTP